MREHSVLGLRIVSIIGLVIALVFILIVAQLSGPGSGPMIYWLTGIAFIIVSAMAFIAYLALRELQQDKR